MGRERLFITGQDTESKFNDVERTLQRMGRKLYQSAIFIQPPIPIGVGVSSPSEKGEIFRTMLAGEGVLSDVMLLIENITKDIKPTITIQLIHADGGLSGLKFTPEAGKLIKGKTDIPVTAGSRLMIFTDCPGDLSGIWLSMLYQISILRAAKEAFLLDDIVARHEIAIAQITGGPDAGETEKGKTE